MLGMSYRLCSVDDVVLCAKPRGLLLSINRRGGGEEKHVLFLLQLSPLSFVPWGR
jgi:hypothetical protein